MVTYREWRSPSDRFRLERDSKTGAGGRRRHQALHMLTSLAGTRQTTLNSPNSMDCAILPNNPLDAMRGPREARYVNGHDLIVDGGIAAGRPAAVMTAAWQAIGEALAG